MNWKKFFLTFVVVLVCTAAGNFLIHALLLERDYSSIPQLLRTAEESAAYFPYMLLNFVLFSLGFTWIYAHGVEDKPWIGQGVRFGLAVWLIASASRYLTYFAVQPWPGEIVLKQIGYEFFLMIVLGVVAAALYRKP